MNYENDHIKRQEMILRLEQYFKLSSALEYCELELNLRRLWSHHPYITIVKPLVRFDRFKQELSYRQIAIKYGISYEQVRGIVKSYTARSTPG